jgi:hypothetical protein
LPSKSGTFIAFAGVFWGVERYGSAVNLCRQSAREKGLRFSLVESEEPIDLINVSPHVKVLHLNH